MNFQWLYNKHINNGQDGHIINTQTLLSKTLFTVVVSKIKAIDHTMYVSGFSCTPFGSIAVICVVLSGYRFVRLFVNSRLLL